jgi:hypothetical protein
MPPVAPVSAKPEAARFTINWLSAAGTGVFVAAILSGIALGLSGAQWREAHADDASHEDPGARHRAGARPRLTR